MARNALIGLAMLASAALVSNSALAAEPSLHEVYQSAEAGKLTEAQNMMQQVLAAHPNSGKAHYVEAELLAKQGKLENARAELANAERLSPGLPFAKPQAIEALKSITSPSKSAGALETEHFQASAKQPTSTSPWNMLLVGIGLMAFIAWAMRFMTRRNAESAYAGERAIGNGNAAPSYAGQPYGAQAYAAGGAGSIGNQGPGLASRVMGGLATGAAVGAGVVAGEALMHHFTDGNRDNARHDSFGDIGPAPTQRTPLDDDMGGADFGVSETSSWDSASDTSSDWN